MDLGHRADGRARVLRRWSSARWRWPATGPRSGRRPACPSAPGTGGHRPTGSRRSGAGPRRRWCRRRASDLPEPDRPVSTTSCSRGMSTSTSLRLCSRAPRTRMKLVVGHADGRSGRRPRRVRAASLCRAGTRVYDGNIARTMCGVTPPAPTSSALGPTVLGQLARATGRSKWITSSRTPNLAWRATAGSSS